MVPAPGAGAGGFPGQFLSSTGAESAPGFGSQQPVEACKSRRLLPAHLQPAAPAAPSCPYSLLSLRGILPRERSSCTSPRARLAKGRPGARPALLPVPYCVTGAQRRFLLLLFPSLPPQHARTRLPRGPVWGTGLELPEGAGEVALHGTGSIVPLDEAEGAPGSGSPPAGSAQEPEGPCPLR